MSRAAVFLDRDGVLNDVTVTEGRPYPPQTVDDLAILPGVRAALDRFTDAGFEIVVVTNQPDVARHTQTRAGVEAIHSALTERLGIVNFSVCYHDDSDNCDCRKPKPGLLLRAANELGLDLGASVMVGDRWRDVEAGQAAGTKTVWIDRGYAEKQPSGYDLRVPSLPAAVDWILKLKPTNG